MTQVEEQLFERAQARALTPQALLYGVLIRHADPEVLRCNENDQSLMCVALRRCFLHNLPELLDAAHVVGLKFEAPEAGQYALNAYFDNQGRDDHTLAPKLVGRYTEQVLDRLHDGGCAEMHPDTPPLPELRLRALLDSRERYERGDHERLASMPPAECPVCGGLVYEPLDPAWLCAREKYDLMVHLRNTVRSHTDEFTKETYAGECGIRLTLDEPQRLRRVALRRAIEELVDAEHRYCEAKSPTGQATSR